MLDRQESDSSAQYLLRCMTWALSSLAPKLVSMWVRRFGCALDHKIA